MCGLIRTGPRSFYTNSPVKMGVYLIDDGKACLIDSGNDKDAGRKVRRILGREEWSFHAIIDIHSNTDHIGGNKYLMQQTGCRIYASSTEAAFTRHPILESAFLYGDYPFRDLRHKFLMTQESDVNDVFRLPEGQLLGDLELTPLPGCFFQMIGIRTPDGTVFLADCLSSRAALEKYKVSFIYDATTYLETSNKMASMKANLFIPAHAGVSCNVATLTSYNRDRVTGIKEPLLELCRIPRAFEILPKEVFDHYGLVVTFQQHVLVGSMMRSYLSWLKDMGEMEAYIKENCLY